MLHLAESRGLARPLCCLFIRYRGAESCCRTSILSTWAASPWQSVWETLNGRPRLSCDPFGAKCSVRSPKCGLR